MSELTNPHFWMKVKNKSWITGDKTTTLRYVVDGQSEFIHTTENVKTIVLEEYRHHEYHRDYIFECPGKFTFEATIHYINQSMIGKPDKGGMSPGNITILSGWKQTLKDEFVNSKLILQNDTSLDEVNHHLMILTLTVLSK